MNTEIQELSNVEIDMIIGAADIDPPMDQVDYPEIDNNPPIPPA